MNLPDIRTLVPHGGAMSLLDRLLAADAETLAAEVAITAASIFCCEGRVGAWVGVEYMAQAVAAHAGYRARERGEAVRIGFLLGTRHYACTVPAFAAGRRLHVYVRRVLQGENGLGAYDCRLTDGPDGTELASATITVYQPDSIEMFLQAGCE